MSEPWMVFIFSDSVSVSYQFSMNDICITLTSLKYVRKSLLLLSHNVGRSFRVIKNIFDTLIFKRVPLLHKHLLGILDHPLQSKMSWYNNNKEYYKFIITYFKITTQIQIQIFLYWLHFVIINIIPPPSNQILVMKNGKYVEYMES